MTKKRKKKKTFDWKIIAAWSFAIISALASNWYDYAWLGVGVGLIVLNVIYMRRYIR